MTSLRRADTPRRAPVRGTLGARAGRPQPRGLAAGGTPALPGFRQGKSVYFAQPAISSAFPAYFANDALVRGVARRYTPPYSGEGRCVPLLIDRQGPAC